MEGLNTVQRSAVYRLAVTDRPHLPIRQMTAHALERRGLVEFVHPNGNVRLTDAGRAYWNGLDDHRKIRR